MDTGTPAGNPDIVATRHSPCDSPAVSNRSMGKLHGTAAPAAKKMRAAETCPAALPLFKVGEASGLTCLTLCQLALNPETTLEKIVLIDGMIAGGRKPATITAIAAASSAYSIMSCARLSPRSLIHNPYAAMFSFAMVVTS